MILSIGQAAGPRLLFFSAIGKSLGSLDTPMDPTLRLLQLIGVLAILGALVAL